MRVFVFALAMFLASCAPGPSSWIYDQAPSAWNAEAQQRAAGVIDVDFCRFYRRGRLGSAAGSQSLSQADYDALDQVLRKKGFSARDIQLIGRRNASFGTGQSYRGLICSLGYEPQINKAFYPGLGHQWQAVLPGQFVYLEGDGTKQGMFVRSWN